METYDTNPRRHTPGPPRPLINRPATPDRRPTIDTLEPGYPAPR